MGACSAPRLRRSVRPHGSRDARGTGADHGLDPRQGHEARAPCPFHRPPAWLPVPRACPRSPGITGSGPAAASHRDPGARLLLASAQMPRGARGAAHECGVLEGEARGEPGARSQIRACHPAPRLARAGRLGVRAPSARLVRRAAGAMARRALGGHFSLAGSGFGDSAGFSLAGSCGAGSLSQICRRSWLRRSFSIVPFTASSPSVMSGFSWS